MIIRHSHGEYAICRVPLEDALSRCPVDSFYITDENVAREWPAVTSCRQTLILPAGEETKCLDAYGRSLSWLASHGAGRASHVVAVGGGVIGDLAGFVAASYMRGVRYVQVPTTLLAQVDSSVGGKVGVDLLEGKNLAGAFYPPVAVYVPIDALSTLPARQMANGMAEVWKYAFIMDLELLDWLRSGTAEIGAIVDRCIALKAQVVEEDEHETTGRRAILNFGHTIGHAIEVVSGYGTLLHGEAISVGMVLEALLGERLGVTKAGTAEEVRSDLLSADLPVRMSIPGGADALIAAMRRDKKAISGSLAFSFLTQLGTCKLEPDVPEPEVRAVLREI